MNEQKSQIHVLGPNSVEPHCAGLFICSDMRPELGYGDLMPADGILVEAAG